MLHSVDGLIELVVHPTSEPHPGDISENSCQVFRMALQKGMAFSLYFFGGSPADFPAKAGFSFGAGRGGGTGGVGGDDGCGC